MPGALVALREMEFEGWRVMICTSPVLTSIHCAQEKFNWIRRHLGEAWLDKVIMTADKVKLPGN